MTLQKVEGLQNVSPDAQRELDEIQRQREKEESAKAERKRKNQGRLDAILVKCRAAGAEKIEGLRELLKLVGKVSFWSRQRTLQMKVIGQNRKITSSGTVVDIGSRYVQFQNQLLDVTEPDVLDGMLAGKEFGRLYFWLEDAARVVKAINDAADKAANEHHKMLPKELMGELPDHSIPTTMEATPYAEDGG
jgi:hypothetical protein